MGSFDSAPNRAGRHGPRAEGARWLSGVLIVAAIGATTVAVRVWPARIDTGPVTPPSVSARAIFIFHAPAVPLPAHVSERLVRLPPVAIADDADAAPPNPGQATATVASTTIAVPPGPVEQGPVETVMTGGHVDDSAPLLPARRLDLALAPAPVTGLPSLEEPSGPAYAFVELPAVMVTRAVVVAGRGIRTGLRATSSVFKAAF